MQGEEGTTENGNDYNKRKKIGCYDVGENGRE